MDNYLRIYDDMIDEETCQKFIEKFESNKDRLETINHIGGPQGENSISFNQLHLVQYDEWKPIQSGMIDLFQDVILRYKVDCSIRDKQWPSGCGFESVRIKRYLANDSDRFDPHVDVMNHDTARRFLSFFVYLNDVEVGGETKFLNLYKPGTYIPFTVTPKRGRLLVFPPLWPWYHAGLKAESGNKYLIHSYCHYA